MAWHEPSPVPGVHWHARPRLRAAMPHVRARIDVPDAAQFVVVGAGIHGLGTGWHLGMELARRHRGSGRGGVVLDKSGVGAGASGIACAGCGIST